MNCWDAVLYFFRLLAYVAAVGVALHGSVSWNNSNLIFSGCVVAAAAFDTHGYLALRGAWIGHLTDLALKDAARISKALEDLRTSNDKQLREIVTQIVEMNRQAKQLGDANGLLAKEILITSIHSA